MRESLQFHGDEPMFTLAVDALAGLVPDPVRRFVLEEIAIVASGWSTRGWTAPLGLVHPDRRPRSYVIVLSGIERDAEAVTLVLLHEVAHNWESSPRCAVTPLASGRQALAALAREQAWPALATRADSEHRADTLALAWLCAAEPEKPADG